MYKIPTHKQFKGIEEADKAKDMPRMTTTRLSYTDYYMTSRKATNSKMQKEWENSTTNYSTSNMH